MKSHLHVHLLIHKYQTLKGTNVYILCSLPNKLISGLLKFYNLSTEHLQVCLVLFKFPEERWSGDVYVLNLICTVTRLLLKSFKLLKVPKLNLWATFFNLKSRVLSNGWAIFFGDFLRTLGDFMTKTSGHPVRGWLTCCCLAELRMEASWRRAASPSRTRADSLVIVFRQKIRV
jgi:hypothetical protein